MAELDANALLDFAGVLDGGREQRGGARVAVVARIDADGTAYVSLPGGVDETPLAGTGAALNVGDTVNVRIEGGKLRAVYNASDPAVGASYVAPIAERARDAEKSAQSAENAAIDARKVAEAIDQHFFADGNGVHVTEAEGEATTEHNILINSLGILLRKAVNNLVSITQSAISFFDGQGNAASNIVAKFGADGAQIGRVGESHVELDYHSMQLMDKEGDAYFHVSDLRGSDGYATIVDKFTGNGSKTRFNLSFLAANVNYVVKINNTEIVSGVDKQQGFFTISSAPADGALIEVTYATGSNLAKAFTFGPRGTGNIGALSFTEGYLTTASEYASHAEGDRSKANGKCSHAEGSMSEASGWYSHAECDSTLASGWASHAEGSSTTASESSSHAEGTETTASGICSHAEGAYTTAAGFNSHAEGYSTRTAGFYSHAQNEGTYTGRWAQTAIGTYNVKDWFDPDAAEPDPPTTHPSGDDNYGQYAIIVGNGTSDSARSNALAVRWDGDVDMYGDALRNDSIMNASYNATISEQRSGSYIVRDKNDKTVAQFIGRQLATGEKRAIMESHGYNSNGDGVWCTLYTQVDKSGNRSYGINDPAAFCSALHVGDFVDDSASNVSAATSTYKDLCDVTLAAGTWLVFASIEFPTNATGRRLAYLNTTAGSSGMSIHWRATNTAISGGPTRVKLAGVVRPSSSTKYYLTGWQNSGGSLSLSGVIQAVRIK